jgi:hypothetical protein
MYYIVKKDSETGKRFDAFMERVVVAGQQQMQMQKQYGFAEYTGHFSD